MFYSLQLFFNMDNSVQQQLNKLNRKHSSMLGKTYTKSNKDWTSAFIPMNMKKKKKELNIKRA